MTSSGSCFHIRDAYMFFFFLKLAVAAKFRRGFDENFMKNVQIGFFWADLNVFHEKVAIYCGVLFRRAINLYSDSPVYHVKFHDLLHDVFFLLCGFSKRLFHF